MLCIRASTLHCLGYTDSISSSAKPLFSFCSTTGVFLFLTGDSSFFDCFDFDADFVSVVSAVFFFPRAVAGEGEGDLALFLVGGGDAAFFVGGELALLLWRDGGVGGGEGDFVLRFEGVAFFDFAGGGEGEGDFALRPLFVGVGEGDLAFRPLFGGGTGEGDLALRPLFTGGGEGSFSGEGERSLCFFFISVFF